MSQPSPEPSPDAGLLFSSLPSPTAFPFGAGVFTTVAVESGTPEHAARVASVDRSGSLYLFDAHTGRSRRTGSVSIPASCLHFSAAPASSGQLIVGMSDATLRSVNGLTGDLVETFGAIHKGEIHSIDQNRDGSLLVTASRDVAALWGGGGGGGAAVGLNGSSSHGSTTSPSTPTSPWQATPLRSLGPSATSGPITAAALASHADYIAVAFSDDSILVWQARTFQKMAKLLLPPEEAGAGLQALSLSPDGTLLAAGAANGCVIFFYGYGTVLHWGFESEYLSAHQGIM